MTTPFSERQELAEEAGNRFYGLNGTIHGTTHLDVEVDAEGKVRAVWFRCQLLPFRQVKARGLLACDDEYNRLELHGVEVRDVGP